MSILRNISAGTLGLIVVVAAWALGQYLAILLHLPVPGPIVGLAVLFLAFVGFPGLVGLIAPAAQLLLRFFPLFLYPLGAGFLMLDGLSVGIVMKIAAAISVSLVLSMVLCAYVFRYFKRRVE